MAKYFRLTVPPKEPKKDFSSHAKEPSRIWIRKHDKLNVEEFSISLQAQRRISDWYIDNGCSKNMTGDKDIFVIIKKERDGLVLLGNDNETKIIGKDTTKRGSKYSME
jgi:hypothetical protein